MALLLLVSGLANLDILTEQLAYRTGMIAQVAPPGETEFEEVEGRLGWGRLVKLEQGSKFDKAGLRPGDVVRADLPLSYKRVRMVGSGVPVTVERGGKQLRTEIVYVAKPTAQPGLLSIAGSVLQYAASLVTVVLGLLLIWRRWGDPAALTLGLIIFSVGISADGVPTWSQSADTDFWFYMTSNLLGAVFGLLPLFCHYLAGCPANVKERRAGVIWASVYAVATYYGTYEIAARQLIEWLPLPGVRSAIAWLITFAFAIVILIRNYRRNEPAQRNRIRIIAAAFALLTLGMLAQGVLFFELVEGEVAAGVTALNIITQVAAPVLFVYAMLRHRLFDFTFAVNRTLVYATVSFILLAGFGLAEWAVEHLIPEEWHKAGPLWSAGIALGLFLVFHRIRDFVEHHVEGLFFRNWQRKEEALRAFVATASYFEDGSNLTKATVRAYQDFTGTERIGLYWRGPDDAFASQPGSAASSKRKIMADDPALVRARHDRDAVSVRAAGSTLPFDLILPIIEHGRLCGFVAVGDKPDAPGYRPDEIEVMASSARHVGLDLLAIRAQGLEEQVAGLTHQVAWFRQTLAELVPDRDGRLAGR